MEQAGEIRVTVTLGEGAPLERVADRTRALLTAINAERSGAARLAPGLPPPPGAMAGDSMAVASLILSTTAIAVQVATPFLENWLHQQDKETGIEVIHIDPNGIETAVKIPSNTPPETRSKLFEAIAGIGEG